jgi:hypothetical protein
VPDNFISGNDMYVKLGSTEYSFGAWTFTVDGGNKKFFAAGSAFQRTLPGGIAGTVEADGPYNSGNMPLQVGVVYEFHLGLETGDEFIVDARLGNVKYGNKIDAGGQPASCSISADSDGEFNIELS